MTFHFLYVTAGSFVLSSRKRVAGPQITPVATSRLFFLPMTFHCWYVTSVSLVVHSLKSACHGMALRLVTSPACNPTRKFSFVPEFSAFSPYQLRFNCREIGRASCRERV